jgi:D-arginine dehydrogenase
VSDHDVIIIGGGVAGAATGFFLAPHRRVLLLERESYAGYHSTGRSGALWIEHYGPPAVRALTRATRDFLEAPPEGFAEVAILAPPCGTLTVAPKDSPASHEQFETLLRDPEPGAQQREISVAEACAMLPMLRAEAIAGAVFQPGTRSIDVDALLQAYLRGVRRAGGTVLFDAPVDSIARADGAWSVHTPQGAFTAPVVVNASGAWADIVAAMAGIPTLGVQPLRRTGVIVDPPSGMSIANWPFLLDAAESFYCKPEAGRLMLSPADETLAEASDAFPDDMDVAIAIDRVQSVADLPVRRVVRSWAGLRSFTPDRAPAIGFDPHTEGFYWVAGLGGYGLQTSAGYGRLAAAQIAGAALPDGLRDADPALFAPGRFRT